MLAVLQAFAVIATVIVVGIIVGRRGVLGDNARMVLNRAAFHIGVPALMLLGLADAELSQVFSPLLLASAIAALVVYALYFLVAKLMRRPRGETVIGSMLASYVNAGNLGIPISTYVLGSTTEVSAIILFQILVLAPISLGILDAENSQHKSTARRLVSLFTNPIIAASAIGLVLAEADVDLPQVLRDPLELLAALAVPTVLLAFGISLSARTRGDGHTPRSELVLSVGFKVLVMPAVAYGVAWALGADHHQLEIVTVLAALPSAQNINTYAALYRRGETLARDATLISTIMSVPVIVAVVALTA
ncbi:AEC family transporter [Mycolicibacterium sp. XJ870]